MNTTGWLLGAHLLTAHAAPGLESATPGIYAVAPGGATVGLFRNSLGNASVYAGATWRRGPWALTLGGVTGYPARAVLPLVVPSVRVAQGSAFDVRLSLLPKAARYGATGGLHLSLELRR